jgi:hypothetical protein
MLFGLSAPIHAFPRSLLSRANTPRLLVQKAIPHGKAAPTAASVCPKPNPGFPATIS